MLRGLLKDVVDMMHVVPIIYTLHPEESISGDTFYNVIAEDYR